MKRAEEPSVEIGTIRARTIRVPAPKPNPFVYAWHPFIASVDARPRMRRELDEMAGKVEHAKIVRDNHDAQKSTHNSRPRPKTQSFCLRMAQIYRMRGRETRKATQVGRGGGESGGHPKIMRDYHAIREWTHKSSPRPQAQLFRARIA